MKAAVYIRTSKQEQNPENQLKDIYTLASKDAEVYQDKQSAWQDHINRPAFEKLKKKLLNGEVKNLYVWDLDRLYRNRLKLKEFFELSKAYNFTIHSYRQSWLEDMNRIPSPWNDITISLLIDILGWMAQDESDKRSDRIKNAVRERDGVTMSRTGKKWGRKSVLEKVNKFDVLKAYSETGSYRKASQKLFNEQQIIISYISVQRIVKMNQELIE